MFATIRPRKDESVTDVISKIDETSTMCDLNRVRVYDIGSAVCNRFGHDAQQVSAFSISDDSRDELYRIRTCIKTFVAEY